MLILGFVEGAYSQKTLRLLAFPSGIALARTPNISGNISSVWVN